ncbi:MAG TPA: alpha/beta fold hydrolase [Thermodesulfobacteriota bacterium]|nr:alpha/beta fold hydrolase [Deltaproteobacteria bacterium]HNR11700.1 alpha/beta fold hydrolase [Thermodesulfobacteriota bacterium]HNU71030.1 alpha/beta fold hydrolase [Thermodesulfobacteriota bacterium]HOC37705.1 alpha/beta fold hydrolase [Thermodesulfobacteriota bacterium]HQO76952.1 alpha/beta fold hydrolase [Thermodesulfobacteriota bacterium]
MEETGFSLSHEGITIRGRMFRPSAASEEGRGCIVLCHGIPAGGPPDPQDPGYPGLAKDLVRLGFQAVVFSFRGAGESSGDFDIQGWLDDLKVVVAYVRNHTTFLPILFGFSAGAAVSVCLAAEDPALGGLILCGCPADFNGILVEEGPEHFLAHARSIGIVRSNDFPQNYSAWVRGFHTVYAYGCIGRIERIPTLIVHGDNDDVVSVEHSYRLYERARNPKELVIIRGGSHRLRLDPEAMQVTRAWLERLDTHKAVGSQE